MPAAGTRFNDRLGPREVQAIVERCAPAIIVVPDDAIAPSGPAVFTRSALHAAETPAHEPLTDPGRQPDDPAVIIWTSGTTGVPKGAWFDQRNLAAAVHTAGAMSAPFD